LALEPWARAPEHAALVYRAWERIVADEKGNGKQSRAEGLRLAGKTGTARSLVRELRSS